jgi:hypothetical protein
MELLQCTDISSLQRFRSYGALIFPLHSPSFLLSASIFQLPPSSFHLPSSSFKLQTSSYLFKKHYHLYLPAQPCMTPITNRREPRGTIIFILMPSPCFVFCSPVVRHRLQIGASQGCINHSKASITIPKSIFSTDINIEIIISYCIR